MTSNFDQPGGARQGTASVPLRPPELVRGLSGDRASLQHSTKPLAFIVAGTHRSGTSALTRALALCGLDLPRTLMAGNAFNEDGYWESETVKLSNDALLKDLDSSWDDPFAVRNIRSGRLQSTAIEAIKATIKDQFALDHDIVIKDPRISVLFPAWREALQDLGFDVRVIIPVRHPLEVAASLARRDGFPRIKSVLLWLNHLVAIERDTRSVPRVFLSYDDLLTDWRSSLRRVERIAGARLPRWTDGAEIEVDKFLSPARRHHVHSTGALEASSDIPDWIAEAYRWALDAAHKDEEPSSSTLSAIADELSAAADKFAPLISFERRKAETQTAKVRPGQRNTATVYYTTAGGAYSEEQSVHQSFDLIGAPRIVDIALPHLNQPPTSLRLDPCEGIGQFRLHNLRVRAPDGTTIWQWDRTPHLFAGGAGIIAHETSDGHVLLQFTNEDPQIELPPAATSAGKTQVAVELTVSGAEDSDLTLIRDAARDAKLEDLTRELERNRSDTLDAVLGPARNEPDGRPAALSDRVKEALDRHSRTAADIAAATVKRELRPEIARALEFASRANAAASQAAAAFEAHTLRLAEEFATQRQILSDHAILLSRALEENRAAHEHRLREQAEQFEHRAQQFEIREQQYKTREHELLVFKQELLDGQQRLRDELANAVQVARRWQDDAVALRSSTSWIVTAPLRALSPRALLRTAKNIARPIRNGLRRAARSQASVAPAEAAPDAKLLRSSSLFDPLWYVTQYADIAEAGVDPLQHYLHFGAFEGRAPGPWFDSKWYLAQNPDVHAAGINPLVHYLRAGRREKRAPMPREFQEYRSFGAHVSLLSTARHWRYLTSASVLSIEPVLPRWIARRFRRRMRLNAPEPTSLASADGSALFDQLFASAVSRSNEYVPLAQQSGESIASRIRTIAFYLPQFHPIPENDAWWGKGFTEWTNVCKAVPQFVGHYQPRLPDELGFYDLRLVDVQRRQVELAKQYGINGFCFHYYWFTGRKRLLERPLDQFVAAQDIDFPFCICWANENWTRRWDGLDQEVLMEQRHEPGDDLALIEDLAPLLRDKRYIRVNGRPLIIVYRAGILPRAQRTLQVWRDYCRANGIGELYLAAAQTFGLEDPRALGFDAAVEFPPHKISTAEIQRDQTLLNTGFDGRVFSYESVARAESSSAWPDYTLFKTVMPSWDNEARKPGRGHVFTGSTPEIYKSWFGSVCRATDERRSGDEKIVFINAWNEWAEGAYLEPDRRFGYAYLQATRDVLAQLPLSTPTASRTSELKWPPLYIIAHAFYPEVFAQMLDYLRRAPAEIHLIATCPPDRSADVRAAFDASGLAFPFELVEVENKGRDVLAFLEALRRTRVPDDAVVLKVHTKVTRHRLDGSDWRRAMLDSLMLPEITARVLDSFAKNERLKLIAPGGCIVPLKTFIGENQPHIDALLRRGGWAPIDPESDVFAAGTMFYVRRRSLDAILNLDLDQATFEDEAGQKDGTVAHALERLMTMVVVREGGEITDTRALMEDRAWQANEDFDFAVKTPYLYQL